MNRPLQSEALREGLREGEYIAKDRTPGATAKLKRLRALAWLLDNSIPLPGGFRIGLDPILGLIPGLGDALGAVLALYIIYEARQLGASRTLLLRMLGNMAIDAVLGSVPIIGDLFDAGFKANMRNLALLEKKLNE
jgi:hypothetical protein